MCKHQVAASQFSAVRLPQVYACTATEKQRIFKVIYGDKEMPTSTFFDGVYADAPTSATSPLNEQIAASDLVDTAVKTEEVFENSTQTLDDTQSVNERIDEFTYMLNKELNRNKSSCMLSALNVFEQRVKACRNSAQVSTFLRTAGCTLFKRSGAFRKKIPCQPTSIARRHGENQEEKQRY